MPPSGSIACPHSSPAEISLGLYLLHGHLSEKILKCIDFISNLLRTSLANPQESNKSCWLAVASTSPQHLRQLPSILGKSFAKLLLLEQYIVFPTDTNSESDVGDVATHPCALCADQEPTVSGVEITVFDFIFSNQTLTQFSGQS